MINHPPFAPQPATRQRELADVAYPHMKKRRDMLRANRICLNGQKHGTATHGVRCYACYLTHKGLRP